MSEFDDYLDYEMDDAEIGPGRSKKPKKVFKPARRERNEARREVVRLKAELEWLINKAQGGWMLSMTHNTYTGYFMHRTRDPEISSEMIAWAPSSESFEQAIDRSISGENPKDELLKEMRAMSKARAEKREL